MLHARFLPHAASRTPRDYCRGQAVLGKLPQYGDDHLDQLAHIRAAHAAPPTPENKLGRALVGMASDDSDSDDFVNPLSTGAQGASTGDMSNGMVPGLNFVEPLGYIGGVHDSDDDIYGAISPDDRRILSDFEVKAEMLDLLRFSGQSAPRSHGFIDGIFREIVQVGIVRRGQCRWLGP